MSASQRIGAAAILGLTFSSGCSGITIIGKDNPPDASRDADASHTDACVKGVTCTPANQCNEGAFDCITGACVDTGNANKKANGTTCGANDICSNGACIACTQGAACAPKNSCHAGTLDCSGVAPACTDTGSSLADKTACGSGVACCGGVCVDNRTDADQCGYCGHSCQGGACLAGVCQPVVLSSGGVEPVYLALDSVNVYWYDGGASLLLRVPEVGGITTVLASDINAQGLVVDSASLYWPAFYSGIMSISTSGGAVSTLTPSTLNPSFGIAVDSTNIYWTDIADVLTVPRSGGSVSTLASSQGGPWDVACGAFGVTVDAAHVYWTNTGSSPCYEFDTDGSIAMVPKGGGTITTMASSLSSPGQVAVDTTRVYWISETGGRSDLVSMPLGGGGATTIATAAQILGFCIDASSIYWADVTTGIVLMAPLAGGSPVTLATAQVGAQGVATNSSSVFWVNAKTGAVMKVAKP
jgi:hypothetical protein